MHSQIIRERCSIYDYISRYIDLKVRGPGEFLGLCPFHGEKTPSFTVSENKKFFHCFGCGEHGDIISFAMKYHRMEYSEAKKNIVEAFNIVLPSINPTSFDFKQKICLINQSASLWYHNALLHNDIGKEGRDYLVRRGLNKKEFWEKYKIGFCPPDAKIFVNEMIKDFGKDAVIKSKILLSKEGKAQLINPMAGRIIFPIYDEFSNVIGFGGRILPGREGKFPKYINSPETPVFTKGKALYGIPQALSFLRENRNKTVENGKFNVQIYVAEGYLDVISLASLGYGNSVAALGTALRAEHINILWQKKLIPVICLDGDIAGLRATSRLLKECFTDITPEKQLKVIVLQPEEDPSSMIQKNIDWSEYAKKYTISAADFLLRETMVAGEVSKISVSTPAFSLPSEPEKRAEIRQKLRDLADMIKHKDLSYEYRKYFEQSYWNAVKNSNKNSFNSLSNPASSYVIIKESSTKEFDSHIINILVALIIFPEIGEEKILDKLYDMELFPVDLERLKHEVLQYCVQKAEGNLVLNVEKVFASIKNQELKSVIVEKIEKIKLAYGNGNRSQSGENASLSENVHKWFLIDEALMIDKEIASLYQKIIKLSESSNSDNDLEILSKMEQRVISLKQKQKALHIIINSQEIKES